MAPCQAIIWEPEFITQLFGVEPKTDEEKAAFLQTGEKKKKDLLAWIQHCNTDVWRSFLQDDKIWEVPLDPRDREMARSLAIGSGPHGNVLEAVRGWAFWTEVPNINDHGKSLTQSEFFRSDEFDQGNYMRLIKRVIKLHEGETVVVPSSDSWDARKGRPPLAPEWWQAQFAMDAKGQEVLEKLGGKGTHAWKGKKRESTPLFEAMHGHPDAQSTDLLIQQLDMIPALTTASRDQPEGSWGSGTYYVRRAQVLTLAQVLFLDVENVTMQEAYVWFCLQEKMTKQKIHPSKSGKAFNSAPMWTREPQS